MIPVTSIDHVVAVTAVAGPANASSTPERIVTLTAEPSSTVPLIVVGKVWATSGVIGLMVTIGGA